MHITNVSAQYRLSKLIILITNLMTLCLSEIIVFCHLIL